MNPVEIKDLPGLVGQEVGVSDWVEVTQEQVNLFADATGDHQWIHVDVERATAGPFGGPIAHGYLTLSLGPALMPQIFRVTGVAMGVNYGANKVRFPAPVPVGSRVRARFRIDDVQPVDGGVQAQISALVEREGHDKPVCAAELIFRFLSESPGG